MWSHCFRPCWLKKYSQPKGWELCFIQWEFLGLQAQETKSQVTLRELLQGGKFCNKGQVSLNIKRLLLIKENQISQVKEISIFLCMGRRKSLCPLKLLLSYAHHLSGASILFSYPELPFLRVHPRSGCNLMSIKCLSNGRFSFLPESIQGLPAHIGGLKSLTIVTSLFTDMAGIISFLIHYVRSFDISWGFGWKDPVSRSTVSH